MVVVDFGVWIDFFSGAGRSGISVLQQLLRRGEVRIVVPASFVEQGHSLLHNDRDFDAFVELRGMRAWQH